MIYHIVTTYSPEAIEALEKAYKKFGKLTVKVTFK